MLAGAAIVTALYASFVSNLGHSFARASGAFWGMTLCAFFTGFLCTVRPPLRRPSTLWPLLLVVAASGALVARSSPEGFLLFGLTPLANNWAPPVVSTAAGAFAGAEISRGS